MGVSGQAAEDGTQEAQGRARGLGVEHSPAEGQEEAQAEA